MRALRIALLLVALSAAGLLALLALTPSGDRLPQDADLPREQHVSGWPKAAELARIATFEPTYLPRGTGQPELTVRGIPGDSSRPLAAEYEGGLIIRQAHVDVDPQLEDEPAEVDGADDAWWGSVQEATYLYVRRGKTLIILSGLPREDLLRTAGSLKPVAVSGD